MLLVLFWGEMKLTSAKLFLIMYFGIGFNITEKMASTEFQFRTIQEHYQYLLIRWFLKKYDLDESKPMEVILPYFLFLI